jgi:(2Fe-2S) ferredoxin
MSYYKFHLFCCINRRADGHSVGCCASKGAEDLHQYMKDRAKSLDIEGIRINKSGCLDRCEYGITIVVYPHEVWYSIKSKEDAERILQEHFIAGQIVEDLQIKENVNRY